MESIEREGADGTTRTTDTDATSAPGGRASTEDPLSNDYFLDHEHECARYLRAVIDNEWRRLAEK